jgi:TolB-like protein
MKMTMKRRIGIAAAMAASMVVLASAQGYDAQLKGLAASLTERLAATLRKNVAVVDFVDLSGNSTELGRFLAEELSVNLTITAKGFQVIDRNHLKEILRENKLASTGIIDSQTAKRLGQITGVDALITGTVTPFGDSIRLTVKALDTGTAAMVAAANLDLPKTKTIEELMTRDVAAPSPATGTASSQRNAAQSSPATAAGPVFVSDAIKATIGQLGLHQEGGGLYPRKLANVSVTIENTSREPLYLGFAFNGAALSDDRATRWNLQSVNGIERLTGEYRSEEKYTFIGPGQRVNVVVNFEAISAAPVANTFSFTADAVQLVGTNLRRVSIGLPGIKGTVTK